MDNISRQISNSHLNLMNLIMEQHCWLQQQSDSVECMESDDNKLGSVDVSVASKSQHNNLLLNDVEDDQKFTFTNTKVLRNVNVVDINSDLNKNPNSEQLINKHHLIATPDTISSNIIIKDDKLTLSEKANSSSNHRSREIEIVEPDLNILNRIKKINWSSNSKVHPIINYNTFSDADNHSQTEVLQKSLNKTSVRNVISWDNILNNFNSKRLKYEKIDEIDSVNVINDINKLLINKDHPDQSSNYIYQHLDSSSQLFDNSSITKFFQSVLMTQHSMTASSTFGLPSDQQSKSSGKPSHSRANSYVSSTGIQLKQNLGLLNGVCIIVGVIVGSGIFISPKGVIEASHSVGLSLSIWVCCGLLSLVGALCYAELGCAIPKSGGDYAYIREAFGDLPAFLFLWVATLIIMPTGNAIAALTFANYVLVPYYRFIGCGDPPEHAVQLIATILVCFLTFVNCYNVKLTAKLMDACTFAKIFALTIIIAVGFWQITKGNTQNFENAFQGSSTSPQQIALSFYSGLFSYAGWNFLNFVTEELKDPFKTLPKAIYISLPLVTIIYVLANIAYFTVLSPTEIINSNAVAITFGDRILGIFSWTMPVFVVLSTFGGLNGSIFASSRLFFVGARNGHLPRILGQINVHYITPVPSLLFMCLTTLVYLSTANVYLLINYTAFNESLFITLSVAALLWLRYTQPDLERPIKVNIFLPIFFFIVCTFLVLLPVFERPIETGISALITLTGIPIYLITIAWKNKPSLYNKINDSITKFLQILLITIEEKRS